MSARLFAKLFLLCACLWAMQASAHEPSKSYLSLTLDTNGITGQWDIPLRDLRAVVPLGTNNSSPVTWDDLRAGYRAITAYASARLKIKSGGQSAALRFTDTEPTVENFSDGPYLELPLVVEGLPGPETLEVDYQLFFETNSLHRGLLRLECDGQTQSAVFSPEQPVQIFEVGAARPGRQFLAFLREGIRHIWTGYDHILFLLALLLPAVLQREGVDWRGATSFRPAFVNVFKIVTAFTLAHSLTLSLATLGIVRLPSRLTESAIAVSVALAAANNLWPMVRERGWLVAFGFGLVHGFGFANALSELGLARGALALVLVGFNLGVEIGQLAIVAVFLPLAYALRRSWSYQQLGLRFGSAFIVLMAAVWLLERAFNFKVLPF